MRWFLIGLILVVSPSLTSSADSETDCHVVGDRLICNTTSVPGVETIDRIFQSHSQAFEHRGAAAAEALLDAVHERQQQLNQQQLDEERFQEHLIEIGVANGTLTYNPTTNTVSPTQSSQAASSTSVSHPSHTKFCPVGGEVYDASVKFCPNHGVELKEFLQ